MTVGYQKSIIIDVERNLYISIPNHISSYINSGFDEKQKNNETDKNNLSFLVDHNFVFISDENQEIKMSKFESPYKVEDLIIDIVDITNLAITLEKNNLDLEFLQIRIFNVINEFYFEKIIQKIKDRKIKNIELIFNDFQKGSIEYYKKIYKENVCISRMIIMNSLSDENIQNESLLFRTAKLNNVKQCGCIKESLFSTNIRSITTSAFFNTCLNKKISVDKDGYIKNCPSMSQHYGNIKETSLKEALNHPDFKKYWNINKNQIEVCKDCEFRHICTDCRAYTERTHFERDLDLSKPLKCGYDPYTNEWAEWSINPLKQKAIEYYEIQELIKNG